MTVFEEFLYKCGESPVALCITGDADDLFIGRDWYQSPLVDARKAAGSFNSDIASIAGQGVDCSVEDTAIP